MEICIGSLKLNDKFVQQLDKIQRLTVRATVKVNSDFRFLVYSVKFIEKAEIC